MSLLHRIVLARYNILLLLIWSSGLCLDTIVVFSCWRIVEKVAARLQKHLPDNQLYEPMQSAYRPAHNTETALVRVINDLFCAVDKQQAMILVLLDLSVAFDTVDHDILLQRLHEEIGVCGVPLQWFESYLTGCKQAITINKTSSSECDLIYGALQGSVLGPILFTYFTKPIGAIATHVCRRHAVIH